MGLGKGVEVGLSLLIITTNDPLVGFVFSIPGILACAG